MFYIKILVIFGVGYTNGITAKLISDINVMKPDERQCPRNHFYKDFNHCQPFFGCGHRNVFEKTKGLKTGYVKRLFLANWDGFEVIFSVPRSDLMEDDFIHGVNMLDALQHTRFVPELIGFCTDRETTYLATKFYKHGSADKLKELLKKLDLSPRKEFQLRVNLALDYLTILEFLHTSHIGTRVMCDSNDLEKTMSQFLITDELKLIVADLDALPEVRHDENVKIKCGHKQLFGSFVAPEQRWPYDHEPFDDNIMPGYDEKVDIWKIPNVLRYLLGQSNQSNQFKFHLFEILRLCKEVEPSFRPNARLVREVFIDKMRVLDIKNEL